MPTATARVKIPTVPPPAPPPEEHVPEMRGQGVHAKALRIRAFWSKIGRTPGCPACETPGPGKPHTRECKTYQDAWDESRRTASAEEAKRGIVGDRDTRPLDPSSSSTDPNPKRSKTTSVTDNENLANQTNVVAETKMVICHLSYEDPAQTKVIGKVLRYTNILGAPFPDLLNRDGKLIDSGQIIIAQKLQERKNEIHVMMVSWGHCVTSKDRYITIVSTAAVTAATYLGFEYRSVHEGDRRGFTVKPTAKYVDECLDIVQLQNAKAVMTPLTEQMSLNLHDETTVCDQVQHSLFRAVLGKLQYITRVRPDLMFATKCLTDKLASPTLADLTRAQKVLTYLKGTRELNLYLTITALKPNDLNKTLKHVTGYSDADWAGDPVTRKSTSCTLCYVDQFLLTTVAVSSGQSELYALGALSAELIFAQAVLKEIGLSFLIHARADSSTARAVATKQGASRKMKHIHTKFLIIQDLVFRKLLTMSSVKTDVNPTDIGTKALGRERFYRMRSMLGMGTDLMETSSPGNWHDGNE